MPLQALQRQIYLFSTTKSPENIQLLLGDGFKGFLYEGICI